MTRRRAGPDIGAGGLSANNPITEADAVALDMFAAALEIDGVLDAPQHEVIGRRVTRA